MRFKFLKWPKNHVWNRCDIKVFHHIERLVPTRRKIFYVLFIYWRVILSRYRDNIKTVTYRSSKIFGQFWVKNTRGTLVKIVNFGQKSTKNKMSPNSSINERVGYSKGLQMEFFVSAINITSIRANFLGYKLWITRVPPCKNFWKIFDER